MENNQSCPIKSPDLPGVEVIRQHPEGGVSDYQQAMALAKEEAEERFGEYMLVSWYDRDRDFESPANTTECSEGCPRDGYINYGLSHGARLMVDIEEDRFVFFFTPVEW